MPISGNVGKRRRLSLNFLWRVPAPTAPGPRGEGSGWIRILEEGARFGRVLAIAPQAFRQTPLAPHTGSPSPLPFDKVPIRQLQVPGVTARSMLQRTEYSAHLTRLRSRAHQNRSAPLNRSMSLRQHGSPGTATATRNTGADACGAKRGTSGRTVRRKRSAEHPDPIAIRGRVALRVLR